MRTIKHGSITGLLITVAALASSQAWPAEEAEQLAEDGVESAEPVAAEEAVVEDNSNVEDNSKVDHASTEEAQPSEEAASGDEGAPLAEALMQAQAVHALQSMPPAESAVAPAPPPPPPVQLESPEEFRRRIQQARQLAAQQRKAHPVEVVPEGLSREELEIRAAERNIAIYDKQIDSGEGTQAIEAYRRYAVQLLTDLRRRYLAKSWADVLQQEEAPRLLRVHAQRMAELKRIRHLADVKNYSGLVRQTEELIAKEKARFEKSMTALRGETTRTSDGTSANVAQAAASR